MKILILEDNNMRIKWFERELIGHNVDYAKTVPEGKPFLDNKYDLLFLDHDLGGEIYVPSGPGTGYEFAKLVSKSINKDTPAIIHSLNHAGASAMSFYLPGAQVEPFVNLHIPTILEWATS